MANPGKTGLILAGGGARAAYQAGVLLAVSRLSSRRGCNPFRVICGTSAGAINAAGLACGAEDFRGATVHLAHLWRRIRIDDVYRTDPGYFIKTFLHFGVALASGGRLWRNPNSLLDNAPLRAYLQRTVSFDAIGRSLSAGALDALALTASCYANGQSVTFFHDAGALDEWRRQMRCGVRATIGLDHLMASSALPLIFPSVRIGERYYCDGAVRQMSPLSPALHLGATRLFVIGLSGPQAVAPAGGYGYPTPAQVFGHLLNSVFADSMSSDLERLHRVNHTVSLLPRDGASAGTALRRVEVLQIQPSVPFETVVRRHLSRFPPVMRFVLHGTGGTRRRGLSLATYLLFDAAYCRDLIALGYGDGLAHQEEIRSFLEL